MNEDARLQENVLKSYSVNRIPKYIITLNYCSWQNVALFISICYSNISHLPLHHFPFLQNIQ